MIALFLDDVLNPPLDDETITWAVVRSYDEATQYIEGLGKIPSFISFDHDLGDKVPSGYDFVKWLVDQHLDGKLLFPENFRYVVHSANPPGADNIKGLLDGFLKFIK